MKKLLIFLMLFLWGISSNLNGQNYAEVLQKSMFFYEAQQAGNLMPANRVIWRADAGLTDGNDVGIDLKGGWFDAGDHVKFNFPMSHSVTALCWGYLENEAAYQNAGQETIFKNNIKHVTDYLIRCHTSANEFYAQIADESDHNYWVPAEVIDIRYTRKSYKIDASHPGTELSAEVAAALSAASLVFADSDPGYSQTLISHAKQLYSFADNYRGKYSDYIPANPMYTSYSGYQDELAWGAIWLYKATGDNAYLSKARQEYALLSKESNSNVKSYGWTINWDDKSYGCYVLMADITGEQEFMQDAERYLDQWFVSSAPDGAGPQFTPAGFPILAQWGSFRYAANTAFLMLTHSDNMSDATKQSQYRSRAKEIIDYLLGNNPQATSYIIGYGNKYPLYPHHRTAHGSWTRDENVPVETRHTLYGALVGGHKTADDNNWEDNRHDYYWNEVATDYNALFTGAVARLYNDFGGTIDSNFPVAETPNGEFLVEAKINSSGNIHSEYAVWAHNRTAWPARIPGFSFRIFVDISEGLAAGYKVSDYIVSANTNNASISGLTAWDAAKNIYYVEVVFNSDIIIYPGGQGESKEESQVRISLPNNAPASAWDPTNDWSYEGVDGSLKPVTNIPLYANGNIVYGSEPTEGEPVPVTGVEISPKGIKLRPNNTAQLNANVVPQNATNKTVSWLSGNHNIATVDSNGLVTAVGNGETIIIAATAEGGFTDTCIVTVSDEVATYELTTSVSGNGTVNLSPAGGVYNEGDQVTLTAVADQGWVFKNWSGDATGTTATVTITMDSDKSVTANFTEATGPCDNPAPITLTFRFDGAGQYCWVTSDNISFVNSWNLNKLEINGVDYTNKWSNQMPAKIDGNYYFSYSGMFAWSHFEAAGTNKSGKAEELALSTQMPGLNGLSVYPNPLRQEELVIAGDENIIHSTVKILDASGKQVLLTKITSAKTTISGSNFTKGIYFIEIANNNARETIKLIVE